MLGHLAADLEPYKEALDDGELGLMFESGNATALADQLERLVRDSELLGKTRENARRFAEVNTWDAVAARFEEIYYETRARRHDLIASKACSTRRCFCSAVSPADPRATPQSRSRSLACARPLAEWSILRREGIGKIPISAQNAHWRA